MTFSSPSQGALWLHQQGFTVFPLKPNSKTPTGRGWQDRRMTDDEIAKWAGNFGINLGATGHCAIDIDSHKGGEETFAALVQKLGPLPATLTQRTPKGGQHLIFKGSLPNSVGKLGEGVDTRGQGGYVVAAGSMIDGKCYEVESEVPAELPVALHSAFTPTPTPILNRPAISEPDQDEHVDAVLKYLATAEPCIEGQGGDAQLFKVFCQCRDLGVTEETSVDLVWDHFNHRCVPEWSREELEKKAENAYKYAQNSFGAKTAEARLAAAQEEFDAVASGAPNQLDRLLDARKFDLANPPAKPVAVLSINGKTIATAGNLVAVTSQAKAGKTALETAMMAALMEPTGDCLGITGQNPDDLPVIHFDTEQSPFDHHAVVLLTLRRAGREKPPESLHSYCLTDVPTKDRRKALAHEMKRRAKDGKLRAVNIDGIGDLCIDPNDPAEAFGLIEEFHRLAITYNCPIICILHENPGENNHGKTRGHLGSQLERKAETNLRLSKDAAGITTVFTEKSRHCHIPKESGPRFAWNEAAVMHLSCGTAMAEKVEADDFTMRAIADEIFIGKNALRYSEFKQAVMRVRDVKESAAEKTIRKLVPQYVRKGPTGTYEKA